MKRIISLLVLLTIAVSASAQFVANEIRIQQRDPTNTNYFSRQVLPTVTNGLLMFDASTLLPVLVELGPGLSVSSGFLNTTAASPSWSSLTGKPAWTGVFDGSYASLAGQPSLFDGTWGSLTGRPTTFPPSAHMQAWSTITATPTTLAGYGITDAYPLSGNPSGFLTGITSTQVTTALGFTPYNATNPSAFINQAGARSAISLTTTGSSGAATYNSGTGVLNVPNYTPASRSFSYATRTLNTCFQVSSTRDALVTYSVDIAATISLLNPGGQGTVYLRIYTNNTCTTGAQEISRFVNGNTGTALGSLTLTQNVTATLTGVIPAGSYVQMVTENNTGTPTFTARPGQETLL